jgi:CubicO group peptidase (beta-lactamase class C family)
VIGEPLAAVSGWPALAAAGVGSPGRSMALRTGPDTRPFPWASVTKVLAAMAVWIAVEEGTVHWDDAVGPPGATLRHLLAHASGLAPDADTVLAAPGTRRIYSNRGIELAADHVGARAGMPFDEYVVAGVLEPLALRGTKMLGSPASGASGPLCDLLAVGSELLLPTLVSRETLDEARSVAFPGLAGVLPGFGRFRPNDWGLGVEIRGHKQPHWTGHRNSPATFGHFGRSGSFLWADPEHDLILAALADRPFGPWATVAWPALADAVIAAYGDHSRPESPRH